VTAGTTVLLATSKVGFDLLLLGHVAAALIGFGAVATSGVQAARLLRSATGALPGDLRRYFVPGVNWAGRVVYLVPALGFALLATSRFRLGDPFVAAGLGLWAASALVGETVMWPAERRLQLAVAALADDAAPAVVPTLLRDCLLVGGSAALLAADFLAATVLMVAKPG
jgi:uncharacterized membrane protein